jgi:hypothetical protein
MIFEGCIPYWEAFWLLHASRTYTSMGMVGLMANPISLSELNAYFQVFCIGDITEREDFIFFIRALDNKFLEWDRQQVKQASEKQKRG